MNEPLPSPLAPFAWVTKRDGRLVPFEADKISRALFAATEALGRPDAFLARELTDVVLHFLAAQADGSTPTTGQIAELVVKIVRELGHPDLARTFANGPSIKHAAVAGTSAPLVSALAEQTFHWAEEAPAPVPLIWRAGGACLRAYALRRVFSRDLVAAHAAGLLTLTGLEAPLELAACVLGPQAVGCGPWAVGERLIDAIEEARHAAGVFLAIDSPEYGLANCPQTPAEYARDLHVGLRANGLPAILNLNCAAPPLWADDLAEGPLFADFRQSPTPRHLAELADTLLEELVLRQRRQTGGDRHPVTPLCFTAPVRIDWHLGSRDFASNGAGRLLRVARWAAEGAPVAFVFDRPRRPVALAEGMDRRNPALLLTVGVHLPRLAEQLAKPADPAVLLQKLGSLARLALSAAVRKREFLRSRGHARPALGRGFLLDRARLAVAPIGLEALTQQLFGTGLCEGGRGLEFARRLIERLRGVLRQDGPACQLEACVDGPAGCRLDEGAAPHAPAGLTSWDLVATPENQLRAAGPLHGVAEGGTAAVLLPADVPPAADALVAWLRAAWERTEVVRLQFVRAAPSLRQHTAAWGVDPVATTN